MGETMKIYANKNSHYFAETVKKTLKILFSLCVLALQVGIYYLTFVRAYEYFWVRTVLNILGVIIVLALYNRNMNAGHKLSWIIVILIFPMAGTLLYLLFGNGRAVPRRREKKMLASLGSEQYLTACDKVTVDSERGRILAHLLYGTSGMPVYSGTKTLFYSDIEKKHRQMLLDIEKAKEFIYIEYFILSEGYALSSLIEVLERKGREGVKIKIIYDDIGSKKNFKKKTKRRLASIPNLELCVFEPMGIVFNPRINYRDHRKIVVIDGVIGYLGGDNIADEYLGRKIKFGHWRDNCIRIEGDAVYSLAVLFARAWFTSCGEKIEVERKETQVVGNGYIQPFGDGPTFLEHPGYELFQGLFSVAQKYLYISTPYFIIDDGFINGIRLASKKGVEVRILVPKIPDKKLVFAMTRAHYGSIIKAGGKIYEYSPGFNHAKTVIVDDEFAFIGTLNCDYRSMLLHFECGALLTESEEIPKMKEDFLSAISLSEEITYEKWRNRPLRTKIAELLLSLISPLL